MVSVTRNAIWLFQKMQLSTVCKRIIRADDTFLRFSKLWTCTTALCISVTSVECEKSVSTQNRIKSKYRSSIMTENLNNLITIVLNENTLTTFNPRDSVALWDAKKRRRRHNLLKQGPPNKLIWKRHLEKKPQNLFCCDLYLKLTIFFYHFPFRNIQ